TAAGTYSAPTVTASEVGTYTWHASYSGDGLNNGAIDNGVNESLTTVKASPAISTQASENGNVVGSAILKDSATITGGYNITGGSITFTLTAPNNSTSTVGTVAVTAAGTYNSPTVTATQVGTYVWHASYNGDGLNNGAIDNGVNESLTVIAQQTGTISGTKYFDVTGNGMTSDDTPMAGVRIYLDTNNDGIWESTEPSQITGANGTYAFTGLAAGTYTVREVNPTGYVRTGPALSDHYTINLAAGATSSGNNFDDAATCNLSEVSNVVYVINGTTPVTNLTGSTQEGSTVEVSFTYNGAEGAHRFTLVSYTAPSSTFNPATASQQQIFSVDTGVFTAGTYTLSVTIPHSYYQVDFVCGAAIDHLGPVGSNIFYTSQNRLIGSDNGGSHVGAQPAGLLTGNAYLDTNNNGVIDSGERPVAGVTVTLTGTLTGGGTITESVVTNAYGVYTFDNLTAGTYAITETTPIAYTDGKDTLGNKGGTVSKDKFSGIVLAAGAQGTGYNFGEQQVVGSAESHGQAATSAFWNGSSGQALIKALNGGSSATKLGNWLATNFNNEFGASAGTANNLTGKTNAQVAAYFQTLYSNSAKKLEAEDMALALSVYVTNSGLAGTTASSYGFTVSANGLGASTVNVGINGAAFGVSDNAVMTVTELLLRTNARARNGLLWNINGDGVFTAGETAMRNMGYSLITTINNT
ncbi:MAG TPA: SdrD B-like domain-containing protein, partial [Pirellulales bacterium]|nr:SdrD B-like domain-containing protein [Pirellulales bacterium]